MEQSEFFDEVNRTRGWSLNPSDFQYRCVDDELGKQLEGNAVVEIRPWYQTATITYLPSGKTKSYAAGHGSTFPVEFIKDWEENFFDEVR